MIYLFDRINEFTDDMFERSLFCISLQRREKVNKYRFMLDKKLSVLAYLLLLYGLRVEYDIKEAVEFDFAQKGKPFLTKYPDIHFNLSHCKCGVACAISNKPIGIDIQDISPINWDTAQRICTDDELFYLRTSKEPDVLFTKIWTIKESFCKIDGTGITMDLRAIDINDIFGDSFFIQNYFISISC